MIDESRQLRASSHWWQTISIEAMLAHLCENDRAKAAQTLVEIDASLESIAAQLSVPARSADWRRRVLAARGYIEERRRAVLELLAEQSTRIPESNRVDALRTAVAEARALSPLDEIDALSGEALAALRLRAEGAHATLRSALSAVRARVAKTGFHAPVDLWREAVDVDLHLGSYKQRVQDVTGRSGAPARASARSRTKGVCGGLCARP